jgi:putative lipoprotein (rSAM/lipoprotein system)
MRKALARFLLMILGALGLAACDSSTGPPAPEYACPYADYMLSGTVVDADSSKAIEGIRVRFGLPGSEGPTTYSGADGKWQISGEIACAWRDSLHVADVDGDANRGAFMPDSLQLNPVRTGAKKGWYVGSFQQTDIVITLKKTP